jgi:hypothetical protein
MQTTFDPVEVGMSQVSSLSPSRRQARADGDTLRPGLALEGLTVLPVRKVGTG